MQGLFIKLSVIQTNSGFVTHLGGSWVQVYTIN